jgi:hypothetical protein
MLLVTARGARDNADGTAGMYERVVAAVHTDPRDNLRASVDVVGLVRHRSKGER